MNQLTFELESNEELWDLIDKSVSSIFIHKFRPVEPIQWWKTDLKLTDSLEIKNINVREMQFDLLTDLKGLRQIIDMNTRQLRIYQFDKPVPHSLTLEQLSEQSKYKILEQNGLKHFFLIDYEFITVGSSAEELLKSIEENPIFAGRIKKI